MPLEVGLTKRDREILDTITVRVKLLSIPQIARTWWGKSADPEGNARKRIRQLEDAGLLRAISIFAHPEILFAGPVATWTPGQPAPDAGEISYRLQSRWQLPYIPTSAVVATRKAANHFGGYGERLPRDAEQNHDLHLAGVYLKIREQDSARAKHWISEMHIKHSRPDALGEKLPDGMIRRGDNSQVIEFGGAYTKERVAAFHEFCERKHYQYELW